MDNITVEIIFITEKNEIMRENIVLPKHATIKQALDNSMIYDYAISQQYQDISFGINSIAKNLDDTLQNEDRLEIYRPLQQDPKERRKNLVNTK